MIITGKKFSKPSLSRVINGDTILPTEPEKEVKIRLDHRLVQLHPEYNRSTLQHFIKIGQVTVDGELVKKSGTLVSKSATIVLSIPETPSDHPVPTTLYEDDNVLVVNKPSGLLSMSKSGYCPEITLGHYGHIVHRLDRGTSGVIILAKNTDTQLLLRREFQERLAHKTYYAIVEGIPHHQEALISLPLARNLKTPTTFMVDPSGKPSQTHYRILSTIYQLPDGTPLPHSLSLVELHPSTGRTHQLRIHLRYLNTPILGDFTYGDKNSPILPIITSLGIISRLYLHAFSLEITIPDTPHPARHTFTAPIPPEFTAIFPDFSELIKNPPTSAISSTPVDQETKKTPLSSNYSTLSAKSQENSTQTPIDKIKTGA